ncbi:MAG: hypothetical protein K2N87_12375 [Eubacterium sp.]|nr:hypothetical protein [Eubacterium sp.]
MGKAEHRLKKAKEAERQAARQAAQAAIPATTQTVIIPGKAKDGANGAGGSSEQEQYISSKKRKLQGKCFTGDTLVCTRQGYQPIQELRKGDDIYSRDAKTGETGLRKVEDVFCTQAHTIRQVWMDGMEKIKATAYHPFYIKEKGWVNAINLQEGDLAETMDGTARITKIVKIRYEVPVPVYNFCVEGWESYFVSKCRVYVHNGKGKYKGSAPGEKRGHVDGENGTQTNSNTIWQIGKTERIDVENPKPGARRGNVHYHEPDNSKHYYDIEGKYFKDANTGERSSDSIQELLNNKQFQEKMNRALTYLGEPHAF